MSNTTSSTGTATVTLVHPSSSLTAPPSKRTLVVPLDEIEWRDSGDPANKNETTLRGHAAIFNSLSEDLGGFRELIEPGFFRAALRKQPDVRLLFNHDHNHVLARTAAGTLELREDQRGLHVFARVDKTIGWVADLRKTMQRGDVDQMSFAFTLGENGDTWAVAEDGTVIRTLVADGADRLFDASVVTYPAYQHTEVSMRGLLEEAIANGRVPEPEGRADVNVADEGPDEEPGASPTGEPDEDSVELEPEPAAEEERDMPAGAVDALNDLRAVSRAAVADEKKAYLRLLREITK